ncbi:MAG: ABC transporter permease [Faecalicatena sp.]|uniref:ABC transporter permease n=1 Tax=Faecalicatena sp. TaxID=2005360 RepID=UPI002584EF4A|nr:ABC transporter permease [Faecalicatena sp.]MCI6467284.1 ABC transporter permease [Faecalicatena sp.]MDY5620289.1 ABC transporter permease [Lachnospiraceae bacterium]
MTFYQLAFRYLEREKGKTVLLFMVLLLVNSMILSTVMILRATEDSKSAMQEKTKSKIVLDILKEEQRITENEAGQIRALKEVAFVNRMARGTARPSGFQVLTNSDSAKEENRLVSLFSYDDLENDSAFAEERYRLTEGQYLTSATGRGIVMNELLARQNGLKVGDMAGFETADGKTVTARITGLFQSGSEGKQESGTLSCARIENQIFIDNDTYRELSGDTGFEKMAVYVKSPDQLKTLETKLHIIMKEKVKMTASDTLYRQMKAPLEQITKVTRLMLVLTLLTGAVVVSLLLCMWMRTRQKEIAVLISLGREKAEIILQVFLETLLVFLAAVCAACVFGNLLAGFLQSMLTGSAASDIMLEVSLEFRDVISLLGLGALLVMAAAACSLIPVLRTNPKDTLSKMEG